MNVCPHNSVLGTPLYPLSRGFVMALPLDQGTDQRQLKKTERETRKIEMSATGATEGASNWLDLSLYST